MNQKQVSPEQWDKWERDCRRAAIGWSVTFLIGITFWAGVLWWLW